MGANIDEVDNTRRLHSAFGFLSPAWAWGGCATPSSEDRPATDFGIAFAPASIRTREWTQTGSAYLETGLGACVTTSSPICGLPSQERFDESEANDLAAGFSSFSIAN